MKKPKRVQLDTVFKAIRKAKEQVHEQTITNLRDTSIGDVFCKGYKKSK